MDRRDPNKAPMPGMIWSDKHKLWMDPDTRTPEQKKRDEAIAARVERERKHRSECSGCCPCCVTGHCPETDGTSCGASRKQEES